MKTFPELYRLIISNSTGRSILAFTKFSALALIRRNVFSSFLNTFLDSEFMATNKEVFEPFIDYFEGHWTGRIIQDRRGAHTNRIIWNQYKFLKEGAMKTTSSLKSWYNKFLNLVNRENSTFDYFFNCLQFEQAKTKNIVINID